MGDLGKRKSYIRIVLREVTNPLSLKELHTWPSPCLLNRAGAWIEPTQVDLARSCNPAGGRPNSFQSSICVGEHSRRRRLLFLPGGGV